VPVELQQRIIAAVNQAPVRSGMPVRDSLKILGVAFGSYYRWKREEARKREQRESIKPLHVFEALKEEKRAVRCCAFQHAEIRHRNLAWRMIDENVAYLSSSTVCRFACEENLMNRHGWQAELNLRSLKTGLQMEHLRCK
jgi:hypothetical protein